MYHKISQMCDKIDLIKEKTDRLRKYKYMTLYLPEQKAERQRGCDQQIADIQALCREIANDTNEYTE